MSELRDRIAEACEVISAQWSTPPAVGLVLGTGLGGVAEQIETSATIAYEEIPHFPVSTAPSHAGRLVCGTLAGVPLIAMEGRFHFYEGYSLQEVTFPVRVMRSLGAETLMLTNAAGGLNPEYELADIVAISDQINLLGDNPLRGPNDDSLGPRFPDMCDPYDMSLIEIAGDCARELGWTLKTGVFAAVPGPNLETRAEYRMLRRLGADLVGMSTVPECLVARHMSMRVIGFSIVTDMGLPEELHPVDIDMVLEQAARGGASLAELIPRVVARLA
jgi:purine-nucleoside phosphorylase